MLAVFVRYLKAVSGFGFVVNCQVVFSCGGWVCRGLNFYRREGVLFFYFNRWTWKMTSVFANFGCRGGLQGFANWLDIVWWRLFVLNLAMKCCIVTKILLKVRRFLYASRCFFYASRCFHFASRCFFYASQCFYFASRCFLKPFDLFTNACQVI